ncbi:MAG: sulfite exporter TauE/SafE family protein [Pseudomonadota bacterium]
MTLEPTTIALVIAAFLVGGIVKGTIGLGLPVVVLSVLAQVMPLRDAIAVFLLPGVVSNIWQATSGPWLRPLVARLWSFLLASIAGIVVGVSILAGSKSETMSAVLGALLIAYSTYSLIAPRLPAPGRHEGWMAPTAAGSAGVLCGMTGIFIVPGILYLEALRLPRDEFVQALGITFIVLTTTMAVSLAGFELMGWRHVILSAAGLLPTFAGIWAGRRMRHRISEAGFRRVFFIALIVTGAYMIARGLGVLGA